MRHLVALFVASALALAPIAAVAVHDTAFGESSVAEPTPQVQVSFPYNANADLVSTTTASGGTATVAGGLFSLQTSASATGSAVMESVRVLRYGAGQGGLVRFTAVFSACTVGSLQIMGIGDALDGFFIGCDPTSGSFGVLRRAAGVNNWTLQAGFSAPIDRTERDGTFARHSYRGSADGSRVPFVFDLDITKGNVYQIRYQWLGFGMISFAVEQPSTGTLMNFHEIAYANKNTSPSILNPTLPLHAETTNSGNVSNITLKTSSMAAFIEGRTPETFTTHAASTFVTSGVSETPIISIQSRATFAGITNRVEVLLSLLSISLNGGQSHRFRVLRNAGLTGASFTNVSTNTSTMDVDTAATAVTGGSEIFSAIVSGDSFESIPISDLQLRMRAGDTITVTVEKLSGAGTESGASLAWRELF